MIDDMVNHVGGDKGVIQDRVNSYDLTCLTIASQPDGPFPGPPAAIPPGDLTIGPVLKIRPIKTVEGLLKMVVSPLRRNMGLFVLRGPAGTFDLNVMGFYKGTQGFCVTFRMVT